MQFLWDTKRILANIYQELETFEKKLKTDLKHSAGWLEVHSDKMYWYYYQNGKKKSKRIYPEETEKCQIAIDLLKMKKAELKRVKQERNNVEYCLNHLKVDTSKYAYPTPPTNKPDPKQPYAENLKHLTLRGEYVRSKSEALLANLLYIHNVNYVYEKKINLGGHIIIPDFTIILPDGEIYWEHLGMLENEQYRMRWAKKSQIYAANGISEGNGLIITRDKNGAFDELDALLKIQSYCLVS